MGMKKKEINYQLLIRRICLIVLDIICIIAASILALLTRFEFDFSQIPKEFLKVIYKYGPFTIVITLIIFTLFRIYSSLWEYAGIEEVFSLIAACLAAAVAKLVIISFTWSVMPRSWYVLDTIYLMILIGATRVSYRLIRLRRQNRTFPWSKRKKVMIIGGGEAGRSLITEIQNSKYLDQKVVCIIDDDPYKIGRYIKGVKVVGNRNSIKKSVKKYNVQQIILTMPSANAAKIRPIVEICQDTNCELMILPGVYQLVNGEVKASKLRPVNIDDLLGRDEVHVNLNEVMDYVSGRVIMVTGGGGSIGSELCRQIAKEKKKDKDVYNVLLVGTDSRDPDADRGRSDSMMMVSFNKKEGKSTAISFLRDSLVDIDGHGKSRLGHTYAYGGVGLTINTINKTYDLDIQNYITISFDDLVNVIDEIGGVTVFISEEEAAYYRENGMPDIQAGDVTLTGSQALAHARNRTLGNDFERTRRQRSVMYGIYRKIMEKKDPSALLPLINYAVNHVKTNMSVSEMYSMAKDVLSVDDLKMQQTCIPQDGTYTDITYEGMQVLQVDFDANKKKIEQLLY